MARGRLETHTLMDEWLLMVALMWRKYASVMATKRWMEVSSRRNDPEALQWKELNRVKQAKPAASCRNSVVAGRGNKDRGTKRRTSLACSRLEEKPVAGYVECGREIESRWL